MLPDRVSNPGPLTYESGALPIALRGPADKGSSGMERQTPTHVVSDQDLYYLHRSVFLFKTKYK